jgi:hypothetical protein
VAGFSVSCEPSVRVAGKGLREGVLTLRLRSGQAVDSLELKERASGEVNAETLSARIGEKRKADPSLRSG